MPQSPLLTDEIGAVLRADLAVLPVYGGGSLCIPGPILTAWPGFCDVSGILARRPGFTGMPGDQALLTLPDGRDVLAVGVGPHPPEGEMTPVDLLRLAQQMASARSRGHGHVVSLISLLGAQRPAALRAVAEAAILGSYQPQPRLQTAKPDTTDRLSLMLWPGEAAQAAMQDANRLAGVVARHANATRHLVDLPPRELTPAVLAQTLAARAAGLGIVAQVWGTDEMQAHGFGGVLGVGRGSQEAPQTLILRAQTAPHLPLTGFAGKGMTFDSGGINLKRNLAEILRMKDDMAGAAAVAGAIFAATELGIPLNVLAVLPMAENMPSGTALRPGDILTHPGGRTTEVIDTDCEGRLILADAIGYLAQQGASRIVDVGTLTDGGGVGPLLWGFWSNDDALSQSLLAAGIAADEPGWRLPLRAEYMQFLPSRLADAGNAPLDVPDIGLTAATFLRPFAGQIPWLHIDNGASAYMEAPISAWPTGATGSPMRALLQWLMDGN